MSYNIGLDQLANRVIPKFLRKPRQVSWINSLLFPLQFLNDELNEAQFGDLDRRKDCVVQFCKHKIGRTIGMNRKNFDIRRRIWDD